MSRGYEADTTSWLAGHRRPNRELVYGVAFAIGLSAVAIPLLVDTQSVVDTQNEEQGCGDRVQHVLDVAKGLADKPGVIELRKKFAQAALLCSEGRTMEANVRLAEIEEALKGLARKPHG